MHKANRIYVAEIWPFDFFQNGR